MWRGEHSRTGFPVAQPKSSLPPSSREALMGSEAVRLLDTVWIMHTADGWYPIQPSDRCKPEDHGELNPHVAWIEDANGTVIWHRTRSGESR
jgi:hypothetical protein